MLIGVGETPQLVMEVELARMGWIGRYLNVVGETGLIWRCQAYIVKGFRPWQQ